MNLIINFFKKKQNKPIQQAKSKKQGRPFVLGRADSDTLYRSSVQKTPQDFLLQQDGVAMDSVDGFDVKSLNTAYAPNILGDEIIFTHFAKEGFIGFNNCAILSQNWLINKCCTIAPEDAISVDYDITLKDKETGEEDKDIISSLKNLSHSPKFNIQDICRGFAEKKRRFGQALCIPLIDDVDYSVPFNIEAVNHHSYKGMCTIEPIWVAPVLDIEATTNPLSERYYKPTYFRLPNGKLIHYSWFIFNTYGGNVPDILKPTYYFGGYPLPQLLYEKVYAAEKTAYEAPMLAQSKRLNYMEGNVNAFLFDNEKLKNTLNLISWLRNNWGWLFINKEQRIGQIDTSLTDYDSVTMLEYQLCAAVSGIPSARLLETSPKGWQSTGSYEDENYKALQKSIQNLDYVPILNFHYMLLAKSEFDVVKNYECVFQALDIPTEKERAEIREINSRTDMNYVQAGVISPDEVRSVLREDVDSGYNTLSEEGAVVNNEETEFPDFGSFNINDAWEEGKHPRKKNGQFGEGGSSSVENSSNRDKIKNRERKEVQLPKEEYAQVMHELNTNLSKEQRKKKQITKAIGNYIYKIISKKEI